MATLDSTSPGRVLTKDPKMKTQVKNRWAYYFLTLNGARCPQCRKLPSAKRRGKNFCVYCGGKK